MTTTPTLGLLKLLPSSIPSSKLIPKPSSDLPLLSRTHSPLPHLEHAALHFLSKAFPLPATAAALSLPLFLDPKDALAVGGEFGILEGRTLSLIHPVVMGSLFFYTLWAGYLGWQWRRVRTIQDEINELKKQVKAPAQPAAAVAAGADGTREAPPPTAAISPVEAKIQQLTEERKMLIKGSYRDRHYNAGSILLGFGVFESVGGGLNTWFRSGKLFPGPHLFAGAGIERHHGSNL
ncbi:uncharacterized protein LOC103713288 isoform X2 [Phoenix dactylifera]|uniref:Uncharacterized protein LOC103713288 isoform X2 n=1 Tax=Phoenix dactylifera TaxID=42345 RepID=A0A8B8J8F3_PHODC|nr:uncharacterized protein LOC103713288 isoform X2 [Phoenix dactylifera]